MKNFSTRLLLPCALAAGLFGASCAAPLVVGAVGGLLGVWVYDDFSKDRVEIMLDASVDRVFAAAEATVRALPDVVDLKVVSGSRRITFTDSRTKMQYMVMVMIVPGAPDYANLKVSAAELGVRGREDEAKRVAELITARV